MPHVTLRLAKKLDKKQRNRLTKTLSDIIYTIVGEPKKVTRIAIKEFSDESLIDIELARLENQRIFFEDMIRFYARD